MDSRRTEQMLELAELATGNGLMDFQRPLWRELVKELLGQGGRRQHLRAPAELEVDILSPEELASLATSSVGAGGLAIVIDEQIPVGTDLELSIKIEQRKVPLLAKAKVVYCRPPEVGVSFTDLIQSDRELLEGIAVKALLKEIGDTIQI
jgi:PilZ domain-containing protein